MIRSDKWHWTILSAATLALWLGQADAALAFVDGAYGGDETMRATFEASRIRVSVVKRTGRAVKGVIVLPKRWIVERTLGWLNRARRLAKDYEALIESSLAWLMLAITVLLTRHLGRYA